MKDDITIMEETLIGIMDDLSNAAQDAESIGEKKLKNKIYAAANKVNEALDEVDIIKQEWKNAYQDYLKRHNK